MAIRQFLRSTWVEFSTAFVEGGKFYFMPWKWSAKLRGK